MLLSLRLLIKTLLGRLNILKFLVCETYECRSLLSVKLDEVIDKVEEVSRRDGHDASAAFQRPLVCGVKSLVHVDL